MRVLEVVEPGVDGVFRHVEGLVYFLLENGVEVDLAYSSVRGSADLDRLVSAVHESGGLTVDLRIPNSPGWSDFGALRKLWKLVSERQPDLVHGHSSKAGALVRILLPIFRQIPLFYTPHAYYSMGGLPRPNLRLFALVERWLAKTGATTINISQDEANYAQRSLGVRPQTQRIIHNPVSETFSARRTPAIQEQARRELGIPEGVLVIGTVARLADQKDPETLYRAFAFLQKEFSNALLVHLGEGYLKKNILKLSSELGISGKVRLLGYRDQPISVYQSFDVLAMSSRYEAGWPISILEAMAQNIPIVTTTCPGCQAIATAQLSHCWTAPVGDAAALAGAMRAWILDRPKERPSNHREMALERFSVGKCYGAVLEEYRQAVSQKR